MLKIQPQNSKHLDWPYPAMTLQTPTPLSTTNSFAVLPPSSESVCQTQQWVAPSDSVLAESPSCGGEQWVAPSVGLGVEKPEGCRVWGLEYARLDMDQTLDHLDALIAEGRPSHVITANLNFAMLCDENPEVRQIADRADLILCDGMPIYWRSRLTKTPLPERVAGSDLIYRLAERSAAQGHRLFLLGAAEGVAAAAAEKLKSLYPELNIAGVECPPFRKLTDEEHSELCQRIRDAKPDILLVAFGQPKGEIWIDQYYQSLGVPVSIQLGASFDFVAGTAKRAPKFFQRTGLEWFYRMATDPKRLLPRYAANARFLFRTLFRSDLR